MNRFLVLGVLFGTLASSTSMMANTLSATNVNDCIRQLLVDNAETPTVEQIKAMEPQTLFEILTATTDAIRTGAAGRSFVTEDGRLLLLNGELQPCHCTSCTDFGKGITESSSNWEKTLLAQLELAHSAYQSVEHALSQSIDIFIALKQQRSESCGDVSEQLANLQAEYSDLIGRVKAYKRDLLRKITETRHGHKVDIEILDLDEVTDVESGLVTLYTGLIESYEAVFKNSLETLRNTSQGTEDATENTGLALQKIDVLSEEIDYLQHTLNILTQYVKERTDKEIKASGGDDEGGENPGTTDPVDPENPGTTDPVDPENPGTESPVNPTPDPENPNPEENEGDKTETPATGE